MAIKDVPLKDYFDARINELEKHIAERETARQLAITIAQTELERRLADLNHAHRRAQDVLNTYVPREIWDKFREEDSEFKRQTEIFRATCVTQAEFRLYKETTQQALTLTSGKEEGVSSVWSVVVVAFSILAAIGTMVTAAGVFLKH